ncbi:MAG: CaiB/BaiF CoA transferase family protein [Acidimicrobiales bacterium]
MLDAYRILDLTDGRGAFAGAMLAMLGAEVILVEPPGGLESRHRPPFIDDQPGPEQSLVHHGFNRGKKSVVVDLPSAAGRERFSELVAGADVVLETGGPSELRAAQHLDWATLQAINPSVVQGVLSPFGSTGPKADWLGSDLIAAAAGAQMSLTGNAGLAPLRTAVPQVWMHASVDLALGVTAALQERAVSGLGQVVDISAQHSWVEAAFHYPLFSSWGAQDVARNGSHVRIGRMASTFDFPAKDGHITMTLLFGAAVGPFTNRFVEWMAEEGGCDPALTAIDFGTYDPLDDIEHFEALKATISAFTASKTKAELDAVAWDRRLLVAPVNSLDEVLDHDQFADRGFFRTTPIATPTDGSENPEAPAASVKVPGPFAKAEPRPLPELGPAPILGADTDSLAPRPAVSAPRTATPAESDSRPLDGLKVLDLTISFAGPIIGRILASHGATVVKVESQQRPDLSRTAGIFMGGDTIDHSGCFAHYNAGKRSLGMNLRQPGATDVLFDMVRWADVLIDSFAPGALGRMGLDAETRRELNPDLITLSSSLLGQTGPLSGLAGYGNMAAALCGFFATTGWPTESPVGPVGAYTDIISPRFAATAIMAAVDHRRRTGEPTNFDFGQGESCLHLLTLGMLDQQVNGRSWERIGNDDHFNAPHGVYPAAGDDRWVAIAVHSDDQWRSLATLIGASQLADLNLEERLERRREIDALVAAWTGGHTPKETETCLQAMGVATHGVQTGSDCTVDEQLIHRGWTTEVTHDRIGDLVIGTTGVSLSRTPARFDQAGPPLGQDSFDVLSEYLGYDGDRIAELAVAEVLE